MAVIFICLKIASRFLFVPFDNVLSFVLEIIFIETTHRFISWLFFFRYFHINARYAVHTHILLSFENDIGHQTDVTCAMLLTRTSHSRKTFCNPCKSWPINQPKKTMTKFYIHRRKHHHHHHPSSSSIQIYRDDEWGNDIKSEMLDKMKLQKKISYQNERRNRKFRVGMWPMTTYLYYTNVCSSVYKIVLFSRHLMRG